jgi:hypothetical protein
LGREKGIDFGCYSKGKDCTRNPRAAANTSACSGVINAPGADSGDTTMPSTSDPRKSTVPRWVRTKRAPCKLQPRKTTSSKELPSNSASLRSQSSNQQRRHCPSIERSIDNLHWRNTQCSKRVPETCQPTALLDEITPRAMDPSDQSALLISHRLISKSLSLAPRHCLPVPVHSLSCTRDSSASGSWLNWHCIAVQSANGDEGGNTSASMVLEDSGDSGGSIMFIENTFFIDERQNLMAFRTQLT